MKRIVAIVLCLLTVPGAAWASCAFPPSPDGKMPWEIDRVVQLVDHWSARHVREGNVSGCLATFKQANGDSFLAYTSYDFICELPASAMITVRQNLACCDAGDDGDYVCGIKPLNPRAGLRQTPIIVVPARPDKRAIPNLIAQLEKTEWIGARNITERLADYAAVPELHEAIVALKPDLQRLMAQAKHNEKKAAIAQFLLQLQSKPETSDNDLLLSLQVLQGSLFGELSLAEQQALATVSKHPEAAEQIVPVLVELLRRSQYKEETRDAVLDVLPVYGKALQPHLTAIHYILRDNLFEQPSVAAAMADFDKFDYFKANHRDPNDPVEKKRYQAMRDEQIKKLEAQNQQSASLMPRWQKTVCAAFPLSAGITTRRILWDDFDRIAPVNCPVVAR